MGRRRRALSREAGRCSAERAERTLDLSSLADRRRRILQKGSKGISRAEVLIRHLLRLRCRNRLPLLLPHPHQPLRLTPNRRPARLRGLTAAALARRADGQLLGVPRDCAPIFGGCCNALKTARRSWTAPLTTWTLKLHPTGTDR